MIEQILHWIDLIWVPIVFVVVAKQHRWIAVGFVLSCLMVMRMQYELLSEWGFGAEGLPNMLLSSSPFTRGQVVYGIFFLIYLLLSHYSRKTAPVIYMAASISIFFMAFVVSAVVMSL